MTLEMIADVQNHTGEGPLWHPEEKALYWVDIPKGRLFRYDRATGSHALILEDRPIGGMTLQEDGTLLAFRDRGNVVVLSPEGQVLRTVIEALPELASTRFNDVIAAPDGSVFAGSMTSDDIAGRLYQVYPDGSTRIILEDQGTPNGMGFTCDERHMYYQDSRTVQLWKFDYDRDGATLSNPTLLRTATDHGDRGRGDGMTVDASGDVWSARWDGGCLIHCDAAGVPQAHHDLPAKCVSCVTFGGERYDEMYLTTAGGQDREANGEGAGALFRLTLGVRGKPEYRTAF